MSEIVYIAATGIIGALSGLLGTYVMGKHMLSDEKIMEKLDMVVTEVLNDVEFQKKVYTLGGLLGAGIMQGTGMKSGGKFKLNDIIAQGIQAFISRMFPQQQQQQEQTEQTPPGKW